MSLRANASQVGDDHMRSAVTAGKPPSVISSFGNDDTALSMPKLPTRTAAQKAAAERHEAEMRDGGAFEIAWLVMLSHGCRHVHKGDPPCRKRAHRGDVKAAAVMLDMLGLRKEAPRAKSAARRFER